MESLKFSLLGGRIFVKNLTIVSVDHTISILNLNITWRYWLFKLARLSNYLLSEGSLEPDRSKLQNDSLSSRIVAKMDGFELFIHNRSQAYDSILQTLNELNDEKNGNNPDNSDVKFKYNTELKTSSSDSNYSKSNDIKSNDIKSNDIKSNDSKSNENISNEINSNDNDDKSNNVNYMLRIVLKILPIRVRIKRGAVVLGNVLTPSIMVVSYKSAQGVIDITKASSPLDSYRVLQNFTFEKFQVSFKDNISYDENRYKDVENVKRGKQNYHYKKNPYINQFKASIAVIKKFSDKLTRRKKKLTEDDVYAEWKGLRRYINTAGDSNILPVFNDEEYARSSLILDTASARINYYFDSPGYVGSQKYSNTNLPTYPEQGVEMELCSATIIYGPWADKQRAPLQNEFFPSLSRDSKPTTLQTDPKAFRQYSGFKVSVSVKDELVVKIPTREPSKDKELLRSQLPTSKITRPYGWLDLKMREGSYISSFTSFVGTEKDGWANKLNAYFNELEIRTSVNHDIFFRAKSHELIADIGFPLKWNGTPTWTFENVSEGGDLFLLREHTLLFSDIFSDFASGEPTPYELFKSFLYRINWKINDYKIYLNVNDQNIINDPLDFSNNTYLSFQGSDLDIKMEIPLNGSLSKSTTVSYDMFTPRFDLMLDTPPWHTVQAFLKGSHVVGFSDNFSVEGSYTFFDLIEINASNYTEIRCTGDNTTLLFYGFVIKYLFIIRDNYFGENIHFKTFEEYTEELNAESSNDVKSNASLSEEKTSQSDLDYWKILKTDNDDDIFFTFQVRNALVIFPSNIFDCKSHIGLSFDFLDVDIRFTNFYMDLQADISPVKGVYVDESMKFNGDVLQDTDKYKKFIMKKSPDLQFDGLSIHAHRMFGIPPLEMTYNAKWDFVMGDAQITSTPCFLTCLSTSIISFAFGYIDFDNSLNIPEPKVYDAFSITFKCSSFVIELSNSPKELLSIDLNSILLSYSDYPNKRYSSRVSALIPLVLINIFELVDSEKTCVSHLKTGLILDSFGQKRNSEHVLRLKQEHLQLNDAPFHRNPYLLFEENRDQRFQNAYGSLATSLSLPNANFPLIRHRYNSNRSFDANSAIFDGSGTNFLPTNDYSNEEFTPSYKVDQDVEYDSLIIQILETQVLLNPSAFMVIANMFKFSKERSLLTVVDALQIKIVSNLKNLMKSINDILNFRIVIPEVSFKFGEFEILDPSELFRKCSATPVLSLVLSETSIALSLSEQKDERDHIFNTKKSFTLAFHMKEMYFSISNPVCEFSFPLMASIKEIEVWSEGSTFEKSIIAPTIESINFEIMDSQISWLIDFLWFNYKEMEPALEVFSQQSKSLEDLTADLVYKLSVASTVYLVDHDPEVLTKPAYILRSNKDHVRFYDGWKVMTRLKHIFDNLPEQWKEEQKSELFDSNWVLPSSAYEEVRDIFSRWRGWEANYEQRDFFFNHIFKKNIPPLQGVDVKILISAVQLKIISPGNPVDCFKLSNISVTCNYKPLKNEYSNRFGVEFLDFAKHTDIVVNLDQVSLNVSSVLLSLVNKVKIAFLDLEQQFVLPLADENIAPLKLQNIKQNTIAAFVVNFKKYDLKLSLPSSRVVINGRGSTTSGEFFSLRDSPVMNIFVVSTVNEYISASVSNLSFELFKFTVDQFSATAANSGELLAGLRVVDTSIDRVSLEFLDEDVSLPEDLNKILDNDIPLVKRLLLIENNFPANSGSKIKHIEADNQLSFESIGDFSINLKLHSFIFVCEVLQPLRVAGEFENISISVLKTGTTLHLQQYIKRMQGNAKLNRVSVLEFQTFNAQVDSKVNISDLQSSAIVSTSFGYSQIQVPQLINSLNAFSRNIDKLNQRFGHLSRVIDKLTPSKPSEKAPNDDNEPFLGNILFSLSLSNEYFGLSTYVHKTKFAFEMEENSLAILNIDSKQEENSPLREVPVFGEIAIQNARFNVQDSSVPVKLSQILEVNFAARLSNKAESIAGLQALQIRSQYCRVCLSSQSALRLVNLFDTISALKPSSSINIKRDDSYPIETKSSFSIFSKLSSIQILSYNFCLGWIFGNNRKDYPGIIIGAERFFAVAEQAVGKFTLMEAYVSVANGARSSNFYSTATQKHNLNRAYLPTMQLVYTIEELDNSRNMSVSVTGDEVDIKFLSNSVIILEEIFTSISVLQSFLKNRTRNVVQPLAKKKIEIIPEEDKFHSPFDNIEILATFAGSKISFYHIDECDPESPGSLSLMSPAVKIAANYINKNLENGKHIIKLEIMTSSSDNVLYSTCVPTIVDLIEGFQSMMKKVNSKGKNEDTMPETKENVDLDVGKIFKDIDFHVGVKVEKQLLTLSCEPSAKVAAIVGIDSIYIQANTLFADCATIFAAVYFNNLSASLQHIYSREISGSARIEKIIVTSSLEFKEIASVLSSARISNVESFVCIKQYQDLELFQDIWFPHNYLKTEEKIVSSNKFPNSNSSTLAANKSISNRFKEVSTTYAFPWVVTFIMTNVNLQVDFGQTLGNFKLQLDNLWMVSRKSTDWSQELKVGVNKIGLTSNDRMGTSFIVNNVNLHTAIAWKVDSGEILDVPLILLSGGIENLTLKLSFDYHVFCMASIAGLSIDIFNQKSEASIMKEHVQANIRCDAAELYGTSLAASNFWDIHNTVSRMMQEKRRSYTEALHDSNESNLRPKFNKSLTNDILETVKKLESTISLSFGHLYLYVFPSSFDDSKVLVVKLDESRASFQENEYSSGISNDLKVKFNDLKISLSKTKEISEQFVNECTVEDFIKIAHQAHGGNLFLFPSYQISMVTYQKYYDNNVEYFYQSSFGGAVKVKWNLGSVNLIREMISMHKQTLETRKSYIKIQNDELLKEDIFENKDKVNTKVGANPKEVDPREEIEQVIEETITKVASESKYTYIPLAPPIIATPQLKELGNATPPLEWFGLHRHKFPNVTHQAGIVSLQKLIHEVELQYSKLLGKA